MNKHSMIVNTNKPAKNKYQLKAKIDAAYNTAKEKAAEECLTEGALAEEARINNAIKKLEQERAEIYKPVEIRTSEIHNGYKQAIIDSNPIKRFRPEDYFDISELISLTSLVYQTNSPKELRDLTLNGTTKLAGKLPTAEWYDQAIQLSSNYFGSLLELYKCNDDIKELLGIDQYKDLFSFFEAKILTYKTLKIIDYLSKLRKYCNLIKQLKQSKALQETISALKLKQLKDESIHYYNRGYKCDCWKAYALTLHNSGYKNREIINILSKDGVSVSNSSLSTYLSRATKL